MLTPRLTNCPECADIPNLLKKIDCKLAEYANGLYNNVVFMLNQVVPARAMIQLLAYKRILTYKQCNPDYLSDFCMDKITSKVIRLTSGCDIKPIFTPTPTTSTTSTSTTCQPPTTTTTTTICERPEGLTNGKLIKAYRIYEDPLSYFYSVSLVAAIGAFQIFRTETGTQTVDDHVQYSSLTVGEIIYALWDNTNCEVVEDGYYWFQSNTDNSLTYFNSVTQINVVTVVGGEITAITPYTWIP
jgi:hypothetical protein